jgi:hypothetical protein
LLSVQGLLVAKDIHTGEVTMFDGRNCGIACEAIWPDTKATTHTRRKGQGGQTLSLWQLNRFVAIWKTLGDHPERFTTNTMQVTTGDKRCTVVSWQSPNTVPVLLFDLV